MIGIYIHVPFCLSRCRYCSFVSGTDLSFADKYVDALVKEIKGFVGRGEAVDTIFFGGGTPSLLSVKQVSRILEVIFATFNVIPSCEITMEANPDSATLSWIQGVRALGVNRLSLGVQSLDDKVLRSIGRRHNRETALAAVRNAVSIFDNVNCDVMVGLPHQSVDEVKQDVTTLLDLGIKHLSAYSLILEEGTPLYKDVTDGLVLPDEDETVEMYDVVCEVTDNFGLLRYEISNFAYPDFLCIHNANCWAMHSYVGFGTAAHSFFGGKRYYNSEDVHAYMEKIANDQSPVIPEGNNTRLDRINEYIMLGLRTAKGVDVDAVSNTFCIDFADEYSKQLDDPLVRQCCIFDGHTLKIDPKYWYVGNQITGVFIK